MEIFAVNIGDELENWMVDALWNRLSREKQDKLARFKKKQDMFSSLVADGLARRACAKALSCKVEEIQWEYNEFSKPSIRGKRSCFFNVSHSGTWVVCVVDYEEVGIDIEEIREIDMDIARKYFTRQEAAYILGGADTLAQTERFYEIWTFKESYIKAIGKGLSILLGSFETNVSPAIEGGEIKAKAFSYDTPDQVWYLKQYSWDLSYKLAVCSKHRDFPKSIQRVTVRDILQCASASGKSG